MRAEDFLDSTPQAGGISAEDFLGPAKQKKQNQGILGDIGTGLKRGVQQMPGMATGIFDIAAAPVSAATGINRPFSRGADWLGEQTGFQPGKWAEQAGAEYSPEMQQSLKNVEEAKGFFPTLGAIAQNPRVAANLVAESLPSTVAGGLLARGAMGAVAGAEKLAAMKAAGDTAGLLKAGAIAGGIGEGVVTAGQQMAQTDYGVDPLRAAGTALGAGAVTGAIGAGSGRLANSAIGKKLGLSDIETSIAAGTLGQNAGKAGALGYAKRVGAGALQEGLLEEAPQSYSEQVWQNLANGKPWNEGAAEAAAQGAVAGGLMGGGINAIPRFNKKPEEQAQVPQNEVPQAQPAVVQPVNPNVVEVPTQTGETVPVDKTSGPISAAVHAGAQSGAVPTAQPVVATTADPFERLATLELLAEQRPLTPQENAEADALSAQLANEVTDDGNSTPDGAIPERASAIQMDAPNRHDEAPNRQEVAAPASGIERMLQNVPSKKLEEIASNENADVRVRTAATNILNRQATAPAQPTTTSPLVQKATQFNVPVMQAANTPVAASNIPTNPVANVQGSNVAPQQQGVQVSTNQQAKADTLGSAVQAKAGANNFMDLLMSTEVDVGGGFKTNNAAIATIRKAAEGFAPSEKAKITRLINANTAKQKNGDVLLKPYFYDAVSDHFTWTRDYLINALNDAPKQEVGKQQPEGGKQGGKPQRKAGPQNRDDLVGAILRVTGGNGIASNMAQTITGDKAGSGNAKLRGLFTNSGTMDLGDVAELLRVEEGFDVRDGDHLSELIRNAAAGDTAVSMSRTEEDAAAKAEAERKDYYVRRAEELGLKKVGGKRTLDMVIADVEREEARLRELEANAERETIQDADAIESATEGGMTDADFMRWLSDDIASTYTPEEIQRAEQDQADKEDARIEAVAIADSEERAQSEVGQGNGNRPATPQGGGTEAGARPAEGFNLAAQTPAELAAIAAKQKAADNLARKEQLAAIRAERAAKNKAEKKRRAAQIVREREAAHKAKIDAAVASFDLGQQAPAAVDRRVNTEQARGQQDVFAAQNNLQNSIVAAREEYNKAKSALDAIGKEPPKPRPESKAFGSNGRANADPAVVQAYDAATKRYNAWRITYLRLKKAEVEASNKLFRLTTEEQRAQNQKSEPKQTAAQPEAKKSPQNAQQEAQKDAQQATAQRRDATPLNEAAKAQRAPGDLGTDPFVISIPMFGDMPHRAVSGVKLPEGYTLVSSRVIVKKVSITNRDQKDYDLPPTIYAWRVSAIENKDGEPFAHIEAMTSDYGRNENGETNAYFTEVRGHARDALDRIAPSIANAAKQAFEAARDSKMVGDMFGEAPNRQDVTPNRQEPTQQSQKEEAKPALDYAKAYQDRLAYLEKRANNFGREKIRAEARDGIAGMTLGRDFGESMEDYLARRPDLKANRDATKAWLDGEKPAAVDTKKEGNPAPFDSKAWNKSRDEIIKASKASGAKHLDSVTPSVETMRGREIYYVHNPKQRGVIRTVDNRGNVYVHWSDKYSAEKESASETIEDNKFWLRTSKNKPILRIVRDGKTYVMESSLGTSDLKDYVFGDAASAEKAILDYRNNISDQTPTIAKKEAKSFGNKDSSSKIFLSANKSGGWDAVYVRDGKESRGEGVDAEQATYSHIDSFEKAVDFLVATRPHLRGSYFENVSAKKEAKEPWQMTLVEFAKSKLKPSIADQINDVSQAKSYEAQHRKEIGKALSEGKPVPAEVLADYPDLQKKEAPGESSATNFNNEDAGEELVYNRRNRLTRALKWEDVENKEAALRVKEVVKSKVSPKPDYQVMIDEGMEPIIAHMVKQAYDSLPTKPVVRGAPTDEQLKLYIDSMTHYMNGVMSWAKDADSVRSFINQIASRASRLSAMRGGAMVDLSKLAETPAGKTLLETVYPGGWKNFEAKVRIINNDKAYRALQPSTDEAIKALKDIEKGWPAAMESWQRQGYSVKPSDGLVSVKQKDYAGDGYFVVINGRTDLEHKFATKEDAEKSASEVKPFLFLDKYGRVVSQHDTEEQAIEAAREKVKREANSDQIKEEGINVAAAERTGPAYRKEGEDISTDRINETFGFRGVNFGDWMKGDSPSLNKERQLHLNFIYDSFMDLANILGVPPKAMSLNGLLGVAVGAQGRGGKSAAIAHFVPGVNEINITRKAGAGALAHEWGHALDHNYARLAGLEREKDAFLTAHTDRQKSGRVVTENGRQRMGYDQPAFAEELRPEILEKFKAVVQAMNKRMETQAEYIARMESYKSLAKSRVESWITAIRRDFEVAAKKEQGESALLVGFDILADRMRKADLGDGYVSVSRNVDISPVVAKMRSFYKSATGRIYSLENSKNLQANLDSLKHSLTATTDEAGHVPQQVTSNYAKSSATADRETKRTYWNTTLEKFARAFDAFITDEIAARAVKNTYLSGIEAVAPQGDERKAINNTIRDLVSEFKTKETDKGVALYSRSNGEAQSRYRGEPNETWAPDAELISAAKKLFGTTTRPYEAGYVLPDGTMLDFTGRHEASKDNWPYMRDQRSIDHRMLFGENLDGFSIADMLGSNDGNEAMHEFMARTGAMRVDFRSAVFSTMRPPSLAQLNVVSRSIGREYAAASYVDGVTGKIIADTEWSNVGAAKIRDFFNANKDKQPGVNSPLFSVVGQDSNGQNPMPQAAAVKSIGRILGDKATKALIDAGMIRYVDSQAQIPGGTTNIETAGQVLGATMPDGTIYLNLGALNEGNIAGVFKHEGFHSAARGWLGEQSYSALMKRLEQLRTVAQSKMAQGRALSAWYEKANAAIPQDTREQDKLEELSGYAIEMHANGDQQPSVIRKWVEDFLSALRTAIIKHMPPGKVKLWALNNLKPQDLARMAIAGMKAKAGSMQAQGREAMAYSKSPPASINAYGIAPNGKKSNLTEAQWLQVRTPEFKSWFGDWEKHAKAANPVGLLWSDPNVSKVVDENGEPLVVYHGSEKGGFVVMRPDMADKHRSAMLFAAKSKYTAASYSGTHNEIDLNTSLEVVEKYGSFWIARKGEIVGGNYAEQFDTRQEAQDEIDNIASEDNGAHEEQSGIYSIFLNIRNPNEQDFEGANWDGSVHEMYEVLDENGDNIYHEDGRRMMPEDEAEELAGSYDGSEVIAVEDIGLTTNSVAEEARAYGNDGAIIRNTTDGGGLGGYADVDDVFVFFDSNQAKSATQHIGPGYTSDDLRYSRASTAQQPSNQPQPSGPWQQAKAKFNSLSSPDAINTMIYNFQDKYVDLKNIIEHIKKMGGTLTDLNDVRLGEETYHSKVMKKTKDFSKNEIRPLLQQLLNSGIKKEELEQYLHARHAPEANRVLAERNPNQGMIVAGQQKASADLKLLQSQLSAAQASGSATKAIEAAIEQAKAESARWNGAQAFQGTEAERNSLSGMSDQEAAQIMASVPAGKLAAMQSAAAKVDAIQAKTLVELEKMGLMDKASLDAWRATYQNYVPLHRDEAHPDSASHPVGQGFSIKGDASKRRVGSNEKVTNILGHIAMQREAAIVRGEKNSVSKRLYLLASQNPIRDFWRVDRPPMREDIDPRTGFVRRMIDPTYKNKPNVLMVRIAGKDAAIFFEEHNPEAVRLAGALKNLDGQDLDVVERTIGAATRWIASVNTQYNPIFGLINFARDIQSASLNLTSTELTNRKKAVWNESLRLFKEAVKSGFSLDKMNAADRALWEDFQDNGGATGYRDMFANPEDRAKALDKELNALNRGNVARRFYAVADWLSNYNEAMENVVRMAAYKVGLQNGMSKERAASLAKNLTVNFNRKGAKAQKLGAFYAFFNASVQGTARMAQTLKGPVGKKIIIGGIGLGVMQQMLGMLMMGGGDDDEWDKIPDFVKERSMVFPTGKDTYVSIPLPLGFNVLPNIGRLMAEWATGGQDKPTAKQIGKLFNVMLSALNPVGGNDLVDVMSPTVSDPVVSLLRNKDWTGKPIYRDNMASLDPTPGFTRTKDTATPWARGMSYVVNMATGGTDYQPGAISWTPDQIDYVIGQLTGGAGRELGKLAQTISAPINGDELPVHKIPLVGRVAGSTAGVSGQSERFYENVRAINGIEREIKGIAKAGGDVGAYIDSEPRSSLVGLANVSESQVKKLREAQRTLKQNGEDAGARELDGIVAGIMRGLNTEVRAANQR